jgi:DNA-binding transcriptional regulator YdaS (Cro superfamily)
METTRDYAIRNPFARRAAQIVGGISALARKIGVVNQTIYSWDEGDLPAERAVAIEKATDGQITRQEMRPDLWPPAAPDLPSASEPQKGGANGQADAPGGA